MKSIYVIILVILIVACLILLCRSWNDKEWFEYPWEDKLNDEFDTHMHRRLDPIHKQYYIHNTKNLSMTSAMRFIRDDLVQYKKIIDQGRSSLPKSTLIIAGLLQNEAGHIPLLRQRCAEMVDGWKDYRILIVENNSEDDTRKYLLEWAEEDPRVVILCQDPFMTNTTECDLQYIFSLHDSNTLQHSPLPRRIERMAFLRNVYMTHIRQYYKNFDFLCVMDMDLQGQLYVDGFHHSIGLLREHPQKMDGIAGNGMIMREENDYYYYDSFAYVEEGEPMVWENTTEKSNHDHYVHMYITQRYFSRMIPDKVRSAFGGIALYRLSAVLENHYDYSSVYYSCEHAYFHQNINMWVNPRFILLIEKNGA